MNKYLFTLIALCIACLMTGIYVSLTSPTPVLVFTAMAVCLTAVCLICAEALKARK